MSSKLPFFKDEANWVVIYKEIQLCGGRIASKYHLQNEDREEVVQESAVKLFEKADKFNEEKGTPKQYIWRVVFNTFIDRYRSGYYKYIKIKDIDLTTLPADISSDDFYLASNEPSILEESDFKIEEEEFPNGIFFKTRLESGSYTKIAGRYLHLVIEIPLQIFYFALVLKYGNDKEGEGRIQKGIEKIKPEYDSTPQGKRRYANFKNRAKSTLKEYLNPEQHLK